MKDKDTSHPNYVGQRIRQLRKSKGVTQDYVSELAGITSGYLGQIERGEKTPSLSTLAKIANALDFRHDGRIFAGSAVEREGQMYS